MRWALCGGGGGGGEDVRLPDCPCHERSACCIYIRVFDGLQRGGVPADAGLAMG